MKNFLQPIFTSWRGSTLQLIAAIVIPLTFLLVAVSFGSFFIHQNAMRMMVGERDERAVRASAAIIETEIQRRMDFIHGLAVFTGKTDQEILEHARQQAQYGADLFDYGQAIYLTDGASQVLKGDASFWKAAEHSSDMPHVTTRLVNGKPVVLVSYTASEGGNIAMGAFSAEKLLANALEKDFSTDGNTTIYIIDSSFQILYQVGARTFEGDPTHHPGITEGLAGQSGTTYIQTQNDEHVLAYSYIPSTGWAIVIEESWEAVATPTLQTTQITPMILIPALLLAILVLWFGAEQVVKPLRSLEAKAARLAWGDFQEIEKPVQGIAEIRHLQNELVHMARQVQAAQQSLHSYIGAITQGQEDERQRLARELHDDTIQALIALKQRAQLTRRALPKDTPSQPLAELETLTEQTINNLRRTIRALRPIYLEDLGLVAALEMLVNEARDSTRLTAEFNVTGAERRLIPDVELALYRIVQESLNNIIRHAKATRFGVKVEFKEQGVLLMVSDNGIGFNVPQSPTEFTPTGHFGLVGLYERAQLVGAMLEIKSTPGSGTNISVYLVASAQNIKK